MLGIGEIVKEMLLGVIGIGIVVVLKERLLGVIDPPPPKEGGTLAPKKTSDENDKKDRKIERPLMKNNKKHRKTILKTCRSWRRDLA